MENMPQYRGVIINVYLIAYIADHREAHFANLSALAEYISIYFYVSQLPLVLQLQIRHPIHRRTDS
jgi:hypothetical protein